MPLEDEDTTILQLYSIAEKVDVRFPCHIAEARLDDLAECREVATIASEPRGEGRLHRRMPSGNQFHLGGIVGNHLYT